MTVQCSLVFHQYSNIIKLSSVSLLGNYEIDGLLNIHNFTCLLFRLIDDVMIHFGAMHEKRKSNVQNDVIETFEITHPVVH